MYMIYADDELLYNPQLFHEGCGLLSPKLTLELNKAGSLDFTIPPNNRLYNDIKKLKTVIVVKQDGEDLFEGRVLHDEKDFYNQKQTYCEGALAYLLDSIQRPYSFSGNVSGLFSRYITEHNKYVESNKQFTLGNVTVTGTVSCTSSDYPNTYDEINNQIIDNLGGYIQTRRSNGKHYLDLIAGSPDDGTVRRSSQTIEFGLNLLDITEHITAEDIFTVLIPLGTTLTDEEGNSTDEKLTVASANNGKDYIENTTAISLFGRIEQTKDWSDVEYADELLSLGTEYLSKNIEMAMSLTLNAVDLHLLNANVDAIHVGDWVRVISHPHRLDEEFQCTKIVYDLENPDQNEYSFGVTNTSLTERQVSSTKQITSSVSSVLSTAGAVNASVGKVNQATQDVNTVISKLPTDYVSTSTFEAYKTEVNNDFENVQADYESLLARVIQLEGGSA